jgi:hypothetical protein
MNPLKLEARLEEKIGEGIEALQRLRDHLRLEVHLATMEARAKWEQLEPELFRAEKLTDEVTQISLRALADVQRAVLAYRDAMSARRPHAAPLAPKNLEDAGDSPPGLR